MEQMIEWWTLKSSYRFEKDLIKQLTKLVTVVMPIKYVELAWSSLCH